VAQKPFLSWENGCYLLEFSHRAADRAKKVKNEKANKNAERLKHFDRSNASERAVAPGKSLRQDLAAAVARRRLYLGCATAAQDVNASPIAL